MRRSYLDNIRWITVILVSIYHVIYMYNGVQPFGVIGAFHMPQYQDAYLYFVYPWFMVLLFTVSGMSSRYYLERHTDKEFIKSRTRKLLVPSTIGILVFGWILGYFNMGISHAFDDMPKEIPGLIRYFIMALSGTGVLWFIQVLWVFVLLLVLIRKIEKDRLYKFAEKTGVIVLLLFTVLFYLSAQVLNTPMITVYRFGIYGLAFFVGYFILSHDTVVERLSRFWLPIGIVAIILGIMYTVLYFGENYAAEPVINNMPACAYAWVMTLAVLSFMKVHGEVSNPFTKWMSSKSWGLYVFHYLPIAVCAYYLNLYAQGLPVILHYLLTLIAAFVGAYLLYEIISRIPVIRWCILGMRKEKKDV